MSYENLTTEQLLEVIEQLLLKKKECESIVEANQVWHEKELEAAKLDYGLLEIDRDNRANLLKSCVIALADRDIKLEAKNKLIMLMTSEIEAKNKEITRLEGVGTKKYCQINGLIQEIEAGQVVIAALSKLIEKSKSVARKLSPDQSVAILATVEQFEKLLTNQTESTKLAQFSADKTR